MRSQTRPPAASGAGEIRIGVSSCLLGEKVRFDGGHKQDPFLNGTLSRFVSFVPVCPEVEVGMGIPREPVRLERHGSEIRMVAPGSGEDHTSAMRRYAKARVEELRRLDLSGYILKSRSPSCGMERVPVYRGQGRRPESGRGLFAAALLARCPLLPIEEEGRLRDPRRRENFLERVFAYRRLQDLFRGRWGPQDLVRFHGAEKLVLLAHDPPACRALGRVVASVTERPRRETSREYQRLYMEALRKIATVRKHRDVLRRLRGELKNLLSRTERDELEQAISEYAHGRVPLLVPITLIRHHVRRHRERDRKGSVHFLERLEGQVYLEPHPGGGVPLAAASGAAASPQSGPTRCFGVPGRRSEGR